MTKIYRMWRYLRIVEKELFKEDLDPIKGNETTTGKCADEFCKLKTLVRRRNYTIMEAMKVAFMVDKLGYAGLKKKDDAYYIGIKADGLRYTTFSNLINEYAGSIGNIPPVATLLISLAAIVVSLIALQHK